MKLWHSCFLLFILSAMPIFAQRPSNQLRPADWVFQPKHHAVELKWKQRIESNLLWMIDRAKAPAQYPNNVPRIGVYADAGVWPLGAHSVVTSLEASGFAVEVLDWSQLHKSELKRFHAIVFPGGYSYFQQISAGRRGLAAVKKFVEEGGCYLGICAGAFLAAKQVHWEGKRYRYPLALFDGIAEGSIKQIAAWPQAGAAKITVTQAGKSLGISMADGQKIYYQGGCRLKGGTRVITLATYFDGTSAIIKRPFGPKGKGTVILTGVHFERPAPFGEGSRDESQLPPGLSRQIFPKLLGIESPKAKPIPITFRPQKFEATVTEKTSETQWISRQKELRVSLNKLRKLNGN